MYFQRCLFTVTVTVNMSLVETARRPGVIIRDCKSRMIVCLDLTHEISPGFVFSHCHMVGGGELEMPTASKYSNDFHSHHSPVSIV